MFQHFCSLERQIEHAVLLLWVVEVVVVNNVAPKLLASSWLSDVVPVLLAGLVVDLPFA